MLNIALCSRTLYHLSRSLIYRDIHFTFNRSRRDINGRLIRQLLADHDLSNRVRQIRILWAPSAKLQPGEGSKKEFELLRQALPKLTGLRTFIWDAQYPILSWLLAALQRHHPKCRLYIRHPASQDSAQTLPRLRALPCLFSLDVTLIPGQFASRNELQKVLITAPALTDLTIASNFDGSHVLPIPKQGEPESLRLRSLELYGPGFDDFKLPVKWSMLERLSLDHMTSNLRSIPQFPELRSCKLRIRDSDDCAFMDLMLRRCKKLEALDLDGCHANPDLATKDFWEIVGKSLIKLRLHEGEAHLRTEESAILSSKILVLIANHCPNLRSLGFDLVCNGQEWVSSSPGVVIPSNIKLTKFIALYDTQIYRR